MWLVFFCLALLLILEAVIGLRIPAPESSFLNILSVDSSLVENGDKDRAIFSATWSCNELVSQA